MRMLILIITVACTVNSCGQTKSEVLKQIENKLQQQTIKSDIYKVTAYYNIEEKILDIDEIDEVNNGLILQLDEISIKYESNPNHKNIHYLKFSCNNNNGCMETKDSQMVSSLTRSFSSKKIVYEIIDLIYQLKQL